MAGVERTDVVVIAEQLGPGCARLCGASVVHCAHTAVGARLAIGCVDHPVFGATGVRGARVLIVDGHRLALARALAALVIICAQGAIVTW